MNRRKHIVSIVNAFVVLLLFSAQVGITAEPSKDGVAAPLNMLTDAEKTAGWKLLFDGKTTSGWRNYRKEGISDGWKVIDGALTGKDAGDIVSTEQFGAFELVLDYNITKGGNSGVMYHVTEEGTHPFETGPEIQIYDHPGGPGVQKTGFLYQLYGSEVDSTTPAGEWNQMRLLITPEKCETHINGVKYHEYVIGSEDWNKRLVGGKFGKWPNFAKHSKGYICLQEHGGGVAFRNIKIRPIGEMQ
jgi:hypothetical protein